MKYWLQTFFVALISSYSTSTLVRVLPVSTNSQCDFKEAKYSRRNVVYDYISEQLSKNSVSNGTWTQVAYIDMSDPTQFCPSEWTTVNGTIYSTVVRACGRQESKYSGSCNSVFFSINGMEYSQVSGRITGYQYKHTSAFHSSIFSNPGIDSWYIDGVSLTHGAPGSRTHVWSFVNAWTETASAGAVCACMLSNYSE